MKYVILAEPTTLALGGLLLIFFVALAVVGMVALFIVYRVRKTKNAAPPAPPLIPPFAQSSFPKCPKCGAPLPPDSPEGLCPRCLIALNLATQTEITGEPGAAKPPPAPPLPVADVAKLFPQLEILECLGRGGMGTVYKARQPRLDRIIALKVLSPEKQGNQKFAERFEREARALAKLHHPNIVTVYDFGEAWGNFYLLMEFVDGLTLRQLLQARKLSPDEALAIVPKICEALQYAHEQGIIHRDIKPENILMDKEGRVKIADFGIAKILGDGGRENLTEEQAIGTPHYMSPEQIEKPQTVDHRADIYSLGVVFYEMLTGELPLGKFQPPSQKVHIDVRLDEIVLRALEKEPERRYQQASEVKTRVETIAQTPPPIAGAPPDVASFIQTALARDCSLNICHCLNRGWNLVISDFWRVIGVSALIWLLTSLATSSVLGIIIRYPLIGGLWLYYLNRVRGNPVTVETAFSGFKVAFLQLVLVGLIAKILTILGLVCLILPGIYLWVAWTFAVALVVDRQLDFWPAMELSRKIISRHWWKFFWFLIVLALIDLAGFMFCYVGIFVATPLCMASLAYAYEDIFGPVAGTVGKIPAGAPVAAARSNGGSGISAGIAVGMAAAVLLIGGVLAFMLVGHHITAPARGTLLEANPMISDIGYQFLFFWLIAMCILLVPGVIIFVVWRTMKKSVDPSAPPVQKPDHFWRWFAVVMLALIMIPIFLSIFGLLAAIAIPNFVKGRQHAIALRERQLASKSDYFATQFHFRVFEADAGLVDRLIPASHRQSVIPDANFAKISSQLVLSNFTITTHGTEETDSQVAKVDLATLTALLKGLTAKPGMLVDQTNVVSSIWGWFPGLACGWQYNYRNGAFWGIGQESVLLGTRHTNGVLQIRIQGDIDQKLHLGGWEQQNLYAQMFYEGDPPKTGGLVFLVPFVREGAPYYLVVVSEIKDVPDNAPFTDNNNPPQIISMWPTNGAANVDPNSVTEIRVIFDRPMMNHSWSMTGSGVHFPDVAGDIHYDAARATWIAPVKLKPGWRYEFGLNSESYQNFKSADGVPLQPVYVTFQTSGQSLEPIDLPPKVVSMTPANGATNVDPNLAEIKVVFDQPMEDGSWSMCDSDTDTNFPAGPGPVHYDTTRTIWTAPIYPLRPGTKYEFWLNWGSYRGFRSAKEVSLDPVDVTFTTAIQPSILPPETKPPEQ